MLVEDSLVCSGPQLFLGIPIPLKLEKLQFRILPWKFLNIGTVDILDPIIPCWGLSCAL